MSRLLMISTLLTSSLLASSMDDNVIKFEKKRFSQNKRITLKDVKVNFKKEMPIKGWYGYVMDVTAAIEGKNITAKDMVFSNGTHIAPDLLDIKTGQNLKDLLVPTLSSKYHNQAKLIAGNHNAKDKIVIFSDPLCPFCIDYVPEVIKHVNKNKKSIALYYYHFPLLRIHPAADALTKLMDVAKAKGIKDIELKVYEANWDKYFTEKETNSKKILEAFNKEIKTNITLAEINNQMIKKEITHDVKMGEDALVQGTPTIFINGEKDNTKLKYETLGK